MDYDAAYLLRANYMTNIVPQLSSFNQGLWKDTENITECYRDLAPIQVIGGVIYSDASNDFFVSSHGIKSPDFFWKTLITTNSTNQIETISWLFPNQYALANLNSYIVSIEELERRFGSDLVGLDLASAIKLQKAPKSWGGCTEFCVNGLMAGNRRTSWREDDRKFKESSTQRAHRQFAG
jgi:endonuclease G